MSPAGRDFSRSLKLERRLSQSVRYLPIADIGGPLVNGWIALGSGHSLNLADDVIVYEGDKVRMKHSFLYFLSVKRGI
jgi:hypothetical protein